MYWALFGCAVVYVWPSIALWKQKRLSETDLVVVSPTYNGIGDKYLRHLVAKIAILALGFVPLMFGSVLNDSQRSTLVAITIVAALVAQGWNDAWFALNLGVYPPAKYHGSLTRFTISTTNRVRTVARFQLFLTTIVIGSVILYGIWLVTGRTMGWAE